MYKFGMISTGKTIRRAGFGGSLLCSLGLALAAATPTSAAAQAVVQPLPPQAEEDLNVALKAIAANPRDASALLDAGEAALDLRDPEAALGFLRRAEALQPSSPRLKAGLARAELMQGNPVEAVRLFDAAEAAGYPLAGREDERGLAYDLVGDNGRAQQHYRAALARKDQPIVRRRLALSQAIAGDASASEATLLPLLQAQDRAAYRSRAFALAILGRTEDAISISDTLLPQHLATRLTPYLKLMPRLTKAQQAAAANLGQFPTAAEMGRDDPAIASYVASSPPLALATPPASASSRLTPTGEPLGRSTQTTKRQSRESRDAKPAKPKTIGRVISVTRTPMEQQPTQVAVANEPGQETPAVSGELPPVQRELPQQTPAARPVTVASLPEEQPAATAVDYAPPVEPAPTPQPSISLAQAGSPPAVGEPVSVPQQLPPEPETPKDLADVFADFALQPGAASAPPSGAVDITKIEAPRERAAPPPPPPVPSRQWVQVATGRDIDALAFDWRRIRRSSDGLLEGKKAFTAKWGETNRLVTGPFASASEAQEMVSKLKDAGVDSFRFTSAQGEEVSPLD